jgi:hypothetical protein
MGGRDVASTGLEDYDPFTAPKQLFLASRVAPEELIRSLQIEDGPLIRITDRFLFGFFVSSRFCFPLTSNVVRFRNSGWKPKNERTIPEMTCEANAT